MLRRGRLLGLAVLSAIMLVVLTPSAGSAHNSGVYTYYRWVTEYQDCSFLGWLCTSKTRDMEHWVTGSGWNSTYEARIRDGQSQWNDVATLTYFNFHFNGSKTLSADPCSNPYNNNGHRWGYIDGMPSDWDIYAVTNGCVYDLGDEIVMHSFMVTYDTGNLWYNGTGTPGANQVDFSSIASHELGHGTGFWGHFTETNDPALCPTPTTNVTRHTMCSDVGWRGDGVTWPRSIETHDKDTFQDKYGGTIV